MSNEKRIGKECFAEFIPWCHACGELIDVPYLDFRDAQITNVTCECGEKIVLESWIVFSNKNSKRSIDKNEVYI